jgi:NhaP-type Na+/H+ or K+/H+ antiporter
MDTEIKIAITLGRIIAGFCSIITLGIAFGLFYYTILRADPAFTEDRERIEEFKTFILMFAALAFAAWFLAAGFNFFEYGVFAISLPWTYPKQ